MARRNVSNDKSDFGIIILGNAGAGKSFICNLIIGSQRFEADFRPSAVTTMTEHHRLAGPGADYLIYNIPGLVEVNQAQIDRNKKEIMKAFEECPTAVVIFVWTHVGGRVQSDDVIAFQALNDAYAFPSGALMFVVNNVPVDRPAQYEGLFITTLENALKSISVSQIDTIFLDTLDAGNTRKTKDMREKLMHHIALHPAHKQKQQRDIKLQSDQLNEMRQLLRKQQQEAEKNLAAHEKKIEEMTQAHRRMEAEAQQKYEKLMTEINSSKTQYTSPLKAFLGFVDSSADAILGTLQVSAVGWAMGIDKLIGTDDETIKARGRAALQGTAAERVYGIPK